MTRAREPVVRLDRRGFIRAALASAGAVALGACARGAATAPDGAGQPLPSGFDDVRLDPASRPGLGVFLGGLEFIAGTHERVPIGLVDTKGLALDGLEGARAWIGDGASSTGPFDVTWHRWTRPAPDALGFYLTSMPIPDVTRATVLVEAGGLYGSTLMEPFPAPRVPGPGQRAIAVATPTFDDARGVVNVCTREPACPMHDVRLDDAMRGGGPVVLTIASPRLCSSRTCGPVVDEIMAVRRARPDVAYVHAEVYAGDTSTKLSPTSRAWFIESEPWAWLIGPDGRIAARFQGPVLAAELTAAIDRLETA